MLARSCLEQHSKGSLPFNLSVLNALSFLASLPAFKKDLTPSHFYLCQSPLFPVSPCSQSPWWLHILHTVQILLPFTQKHIQIFMSSYPKLPFLSSPAHPLALFFHHVILAHQMVVSAVTGWEPHVCSWPDYCCPILDRADHDYL